MSRAQDFGGAAWNLADLIARVTQSPFTLFVHTPPRMASGEIEAMAAGAARHRADFPRHQVIAACATPAAAALVRGSGLPARSMNRNAFIDETAFRPLPLLTKQFDAVCVLHEHSPGSVALAARFGSVCVIDDSDDDQNRALLREAIAALPHATFPNGNWLAPAERFCHLSAEEMCRLINRSRVGVCGSPDADCGAAIQYQLCGLPVIAAAADDIRRDPLETLAPPLAIRNAVLPRLYEWRGRWRKFVAEACVEMNGAGADDFAENFRHIRQYRFGMPIHSVAGLARALQAGAWTDPELATAPNAPATAGGARASSWADAQTDDWVRRRPNRRAAHAAYARLNDAADDVFLFEFADGSVRITPKPQYTDAELAQAPDVLLQRARWYRDFFATVAASRELRQAGVVAMSMHDTPTHDPGFPMFAFQKLAGTSPILVPDIDAIRLGFYADAPADQVAYASKRDSAIFVGSTTGEMHSEASVAALTSQRLRSGVFFKTVQEVDFRLPQIVQCLTPGAEAAIRGLGFGHGLSGWEEQLKHKFLLSMDGNGATCSRVAIALKSNSVLIKYGSAYRLFYSEGLQPWKHYLPADKDADVISFVHAERNQPGLYESVAQNGQHFFDEHLGAAASIRYTGEVLLRYFACFS